MAFVIPEVGEIQLLEDLQANRLEGSHMHAYKNDVAPGPATVLGDFTECNFAGYAPFPLVGWSPAALDGTGHAATNAPKATFTPTAVGGSGNIYGYYITDDADGSLIGAERFSDAPVAIAQFANLEVNHTFTTKSEF